MMMKFIKDTNIFHSEVAYIMYVIGF